MIQNGLSYNICSAFSKKDNPDNLDGAEFNG